MRYLFLLTITPVQDFIAQSRKLKDLFGGSDILSTMSKVGVEYAKECGAEIIFPQNIVGSNSYPNRFLVEISFDSEEELKTFAQNASNKVLDYFKSLNETDSTIVEKHIENFFQIYWSASEYENDYKKAFDEIEKRLAGAKNTRFFKQLGEVGRKCSICGERNVAVYNGKLAMIKERFDNDKPIKSNIAQDGEGLCGVCYIKRKYAKTKFDSTADVALMNIPIKQKYHLLNKESQLFYEENITKTYFEKNAIDVGKLDEYKKELKAFQSEIKDRYKQSSYYAVVMFDGDDMGQWLSGEKLADKSKLKEFHIDISQHLATFAKKAKEILKEPKGVTVYAGGEDFLGFVNINNLFEVLKELNSEFREMISNPLKSKYGLVDDFTFSAGVVIAHYKTPLGTVLNEARKSEKKAKQNSGKDSVCLTVLKRSGEIREAITKHKNIETIQKVILKIRDDFSDSFIANLEREFLIMVDNEGVLELKKSLMVTEIERLLKRSKKNEDANIEDMKALISALYTKQFNDFSNLLNIAKFVNREI